MSDTMKNDQLKNVVKYVVEYAYHQFKREFGDDDHSKELTRRYKAALLSSTEVLIEKVHSLYGPQQRDNLGKTTNLAIIYLAQIIQCTDHQVKGKLIDGEFFSYQFSISAFPSGKSITLERRYSDLKLLQSCIEKDYPTLLVPYLPTGINSVTASKIDYRKRNLAMWIEYVLNLPQLKSYPPIVSYFSSCECVTNPEKLMENPPYVVEIYLRNLQASSINCGKENSMTSGVVVQRSCQIISSQLRWMTPIGVEVIQKGERLALCCEHRDYESGRFEMLPISTAWIGSLTLVNEAHVKFGADVNSIILEPLSLFYGSCLKRANDIFSTNRFCGPHSVINGEDMKPADIFLRSWYSGRRIRAATILAKMIGFVRGMIDWSKQFRIKLSEVLEEDCPVVSMPVDYKKAGHENGGWMNRMLGRVTMPLGSRRNPTTQSNSIRSLVQENRADSEHTISHDTPSFHHEPSSKRRINPHRLKKSANQPGFPAHFFDAPHVVTSNTIDDDYKDAPLEHKAQSLHDENFERTQSLATLPDGWATALDANGNVYYYHQAAKISRWEPPTPDFAALVDQKLASFNDVVSLKSQKRIEELEQERQRQIVRDAIADNLKGELRSALRKWRHPPHLSHPRDFGELLASLHTILPSIGENDITGTDCRDLSLKSSSEAIKRAYLRAIRYLHPDKINATLTEEEKILAGEVFVCINEEYQLFKSQRQL